jgi:hypothetical protein
MRLRIVNTCGIKGLGFPALVCLTLLLMMLPGVCGASGAEAGFTFAIVGDRTGGAVEDVYERVLDEVAFLKPDFIITVGDHIQGYTPDSSEVEAEWDYVLEILDDTGIDYHLTAGNHDIWDGQSRRIWKRRFGDPDKTFEYKGNLFIMLDVSTYYNAGSLPEDRMTWLERELRRSDKYENVFVFYHKPFWCEDFSFRRPNLLHDMFRRYGVRAVFTGHYHRHFYAEVDGIRYFGVSSSGGSLPWGGRVKGSFFAWLHARVTGERVDIRLLEPGFTQPVDVLTVDDAMVIAEIEQEAVKVNDIVVDDARLAGTERVTVTIANPSGTTLQDTAVWILRDGWSVEPARDYVEVPPGEVGTITAFVTHDGPLYPVPMLRVHLPVGEEMLEVTEPLRIRRVISSKATTDSLETDGLIVEPVWGEATGATEFFGFSDPSADAHFNRTVLKICHDSSNLYVAIRCVDSAINEIAADVTERDGFMRYDDNVSLLLEPVPGSQVFYQIAVNPAGTLSDQRIEICPFGTWVLHPEWDPPIEVATHVLGDRWQVELKIPLSAFGTSSVEGAAWGINFQRWHRRLRTVSQFQSPFRFDSDSMGLLRFQ